MSAQVFIIDACVATLHKGPLDNAGRADVAQQVERGERPPDYAEEEAKCKYRLQLDANDDLGIIMKNLYLFFSR